MRYVALVFLGVVLWAGQASAVKIEGKPAVKIVLEGTIIRKHVVNDVSLNMRVLHKGKYYVCKDGKLGDKSYLSCYSVE